jgi:hypothetical protein
MSLDGSPDPYEAYYDEENQLNMSTIEELSYTPTMEERYRDAAQVATTGRTNWKTLRGRGEAVWPPHLYVVLFCYLQPTD